MLKKSVGWLINCLIFLGVSLLVYVSVEVFFLRIFTSVLPLSMAQKLDEFEGLWPLLQSSKQGFYPRNYIALVGDSYAMGMGDAMYEPIPNARQPRFGSAHTIQDLTGRDVVTFGQPGSGSVRGMISNPAAGLYYLRKVVNRNFPSPSWVLIYFYEGNDLTENWMYYENTFLPGYAADTYNDPKVFDRYVRDTVMGRQHLVLAADATASNYQLFFCRFIYRVFAENVLGKKFYRKKYPGEFGMVYVPQSRWVPRKIPEPVNHALIAGHVVPLPDNLQGPSLDLSQEQLQHAVGTFSKSLAWSRAYFSNAQVAVVFIPSVLSSYQMVGDSVVAQNYLSDSDTRFSTQALESRHRWIESEIARVSREQGVAFIDTTSDIRAASAIQPLHGSNDWNHFNRQGYAVLGESVVRQLPALRNKP